MKITSRQVTDRLGCDDTQLLRLREIMGIPGAGSGNRLEYDRRTADVFVSLHTLMRDLGTINDSKIRTGLSWDAYSRIGAQLLDAEHAVLEHGIVRISARLITTDWESVPVLEKAG